MARSIEAPGRWNPTVRSWAEWRTLREKATTEEDRLKKDILGALEQRGTEMSGGHRMLTTEKVRVGKKWIKGLQRQRRVSQSLNQILAMAWLKQNGLLEECMVTETNTYFSEDALLSLNFQGKIPDTVMKDFYEEKETFALTLIEADDDDDESE